MISAEEFLELLDSGKLSDEEVQKMIEPELEWWEERNRRVEAHEALEAQREATGADKDK